MYRRDLLGMVERGKTRAFLDAMLAVRDYQRERGIRARTAVWAAMTGRTNSTIISGDFNTLDDLEKFTDMAARDARFAELRRAVRSQMVFEETNVTIAWMAYHSEGLVTSEDSTAPRKYMRRLTGEVAPGGHRDFIHSISQALEYQKQRGIDATTSVWSMMTGHTNAIAIVAEFDTMTELERFEEMAANDADFAKLRRATRESMVFLTSRVALFRNLM